MLRNLVRRLYHAVAEGQAMGFREVDHGRKGKDVHEAVNQYFIRAGYKTGKENGRMHRFFHGTGHGLGLELHEAPRLSAPSPDRLQTGHVVTVEPGLYYPQLSGVRLEDVAYICKLGTRNLTKFENQLEV